MPSFETCALNGSMGVPQQVNAKARTEVRDAANVSIDAPFAPSCIGMKQAADEVYQAVHQAADD